MNDLHEARTSEQYHAEQVDDLPPTPEEAGGVWQLTRPAIKEALQIVAPALILALVVHLFLAQATVVFGQSMEPNLHPHQRLIVDKISYRLHAPQRNDIVVIDLPSMEELLVKRIVAMPGEVVEIRRGVVYVNGQPIAEPFPHDTTPIDMAPMTLGPLSYFVLGDNRSNSNDSRAFGPVTLDQILGRVWLRYWPLDEFYLF
ncbi:MAG TPA: signal peptidase I [Chloroflexi bacterium]|nr:signal peptidase I [Chloroflexota bacterium]